MLRVYTQWSPGFRKIQYLENTQLDIARGLQLFFITKIEELYKKLTGIDFQQLINLK